MDKDSFKASLINIINISKVYGPKWNGILKDENEVGFCAIQGIFKKCENIGAFLPLAPNDMLDYYVFQYVWQFFDH